MLLKTEFDERGLLKSDPLFTNQSKVKHAIVSDGSHYTKIYISNYLDTNKSYVIEPTVVLSQVPKVVYFIIPGNPGVSRAYLPWLLHLHNILGDDSLIIFSGHLGHLESADPTMESTCEENIHHQHQALATVLNFTRNHPQTRVCLAGHSAGAHFIVHALKRYLEDSLNADAVTSSSSDDDVVSSSLTLILYCGTLVQFEGWGRFRALVAASDAGERWINRMRTSNFLARRIQSQYHQDLLSEFSERFVRQMSSLTRDELQNLPCQIDEEIRILQAMKNVNCYFLMAEKDPYVAKTMQAKYFNAFGPDKVYISSTWWHAFILHSGGFQEAADITKAIIMTGEIPLKYKENMLQTIKLNSWRPDIRNLFASLAARMWIIGESVKSMCTRRDVKTRG